MFQSPSLGNLVDSSKKSKAKTRLDVPTIRFSVKLEKPSAEQFNEFNYNKLLVKALKHSKHQLRREEKSREDEEDEDNNNNPQLTKMVIKSDDEFSLLDGPFQIERDEIRTLLRAYRDKLVLGKHMADMEENEDGNNQAGGDEDDDENNSGCGENMDDMDDMDEVDKKSKKKKFDSATADIIGSIRLKYTDLGHLGKGYDGNDSFIDDSDAIDVQVPKNMATKHGGFYMNKAKVQLERIEEKKRHKKKKRARVVDEEEEEEEEEKNTSSRIQNGDTANEDEEDEEDDDFEGEDGDGDEDDDDDEDSDGSSSDDFTDSEDSDVYETTSSEEDIENHQQDLQQLNNNKGDDVVKQTAKRKKIESDDENSGEPTRQNGGGISTTSKEIISSIKDKENKQQLASMSISKKTRKEEPGDEQKHVNTNEPTLKINKPAGTSSTADKPSQGLFNNQNMNKSSALVNNKKPVDTPSSVSAGTVGQTSQATVTTMKNSVSKEQNSSINTNTSMSSCSNGGLPTGISDSLRRNIENFLVTFNTSGNLSNPQKVWTSSIKADLFKIYTESHKLPNHKDHVQIFNYMSEKMNRSRDNLIRLCRKMTNKSTSPIQAAVGGMAGAGGSGQSAAGVVQTPTHTGVSRQSVQATTPVKQAQHNLTQQSPLSSIQLNLNDMSPDLREKLSTLKSEFLAFKQKPENQHIVGGSGGSNDRLVHRFFEMTQIQDQVFRMENSIRTGSGSQTAKPPRVREFCHSYLANIFQVSREMLVARYSHSFNQTRRRNFETALSNKMSELKAEIEASMPRNLDKYNKSMEEYNRSKSDPAVVSGEKKLTTVPRKRIEWTDKLRDLVSAAIRYKLNLYTSHSSTANSSLLASPQTPGGNKPILDPASLDQQEREKRLEYIKQFFDEELINLWPSNWMQRNVLLNVYERMLATQGKKAANPATTSQNQIQQQPQSQIKQQQQQPIKPSAQQQQQQQNRQPNQQQHSKSANATPIQQPAKPVTNSAHNSNQNNNNIAKMSYSSTTPVVVSNGSNYSSQKTSPATTASSSQKSNNQSGMNNKQNQSQQQGVNSSTASKMHHSHSNGSMQVINASAKSGKPISIEYQPMTSNQQAASIKSTHTVTNNNNNINTSRSSQFSQSQEKANVARPSSATAAAAAAAAHSHPHQSFLQSQQPFSHVDDAEMQAFQSQLTKTIAAALMQSPLAFPSSASATQLTHHHRNPDGKKAGGSGTTPTTNMPYQQHSFN